MKHLTGCLLVFFAFSPASAEDADTRLEKPEAGLKGYTGQGKIPPDALLKKLEKAMADAMAEVAKDQKKPPADEDPGYEDVPFSGPE